MQHKSANFRWMQTRLLASVVAVVVRKLKITGARSNLYLRRNITQMDSQKKKKNSLECELEKKKSRDSKSRQSTC